MVSSADAQTDWNQSTEIGSYQSILKRAGYGTRPSQDAVPAVPGEMPQASVGQKPLKLAKRLKDASVAQAITAWSAVADLIAVAAQHVAAVALAGCLREIMPAVARIPTPSLVFADCILLVISEDDVRLSQNGAGDILLSTDANYNMMGGFQFDITKRNVDGNGLQFVYWGLYPGQQYAEIVGPGLDHLRDRIGRRFG